MKNLVVLFTGILMLFSIVSLAQDNSKKANLAYIDLSTGKSALGSGFYATFGINHGLNSVQLTMAEEKIFLNYFFKVKSLKFGPTAGYFQNVPFAGAITNLEFLKHFSNLTWGGYSFGQPQGDFSLYPSFLFLVNTTGVEIWKTKLSYSVVFFQNNPAKNILTMRFTQKIESRMSAYTDIAYDFTNRTQLLKVGVNIKM